MSSVAKLRVGSEELSLWYDIRLVSVAILDNGREKNSSFVVFQLAEQKSYVRRYCYCVY